ncbi:MAG: histidine kinase, partial [Oscillospiraceae bacterium]
MLTNVKERTQESIMTSVDNAVKMTSTRIEASVNSSVAAAYRTEINDAYAQSKIDKDFSARYSAVKDHLEQQYKQDEKFIGTSVTFYDDMDTMCFTTNSEKGSVAPNFKKDTSEIIRLLGPVIGYDIKFFVSNENLYMMRNIRDKSYVPYAVLCMQINDELMFNSMRNILMVNSVTVWIGDEEYNVMGDVDSTKYKDLTFKKNKAIMQETENGSLIYGEVEGDMYKMRYCVEADSNALLEELSEFTVVIIIMSAMMIPLLMLVVLFFYYKITRPINALTLAAKRVEEGDFTKKVEGKFTSLELSYLAETFDRMTDKLQNQFQKIYKEELALRDAKIMALQLQMNPHFLNNTLEIINWEARFAGDEKISRMLECLSVMLSATMDRKKQRIVHLEEE